MQPCFLPSEGSRLEAALQGRSRRKQLFDKTATNPAKMSIHDQSKRMSFETSEEVKVAPTFEAMGLKEDLLRGVYAYSEHAHERIQVISIVV